MARRGATDLSGILAIDKPAAMTSHDVVSVVRRVTGERRVGHAGTLDPSATGVLVVLVGPATRLAPYLTAARKSYDARIVFGSETDTDDADGEVSHTAPIPPEFSNVEFAAAKVSALMGTHEQVPPAYSAIKRDGVVAHRAARAGDELVLEARTIEVADARLLGVEEGPPVAWNVSFEVSKGTYIRALARDLGRALDSAAHLDGLRRTRSGAVSIGDTITLADLEHVTAEQLPALFLPASRALELETAQVDADTRARVEVGRALPLDSIPESRLDAGQQLALTHGGRLVAIYERIDDSLKPATVIPGGVA